MGTRRNEKLYAARLALGWFSHNAAARGISDAGKGALGDRAFGVSVRTVRR